MLSKLNPFNTLFGRIFASFWLIIIMIILSGLGVRWYFTSQDQLIDLSARQLADVERTMGLIEHVSRNRPFASLDEKVDLVSKRAHSFLALVSLDTKEIHRARLPIPIPEKKLVSLAEQTEIYGFRHKGSVFYGPVRVTIDDQQYGAFVGKPLSFQRVRELGRQYPWLTPTIAVLVSGILCFWLSWSLVKPLRRLQRASHALASGDLSARIDSGLKRKDEMGQLSRDFNTMSSKIENLLDGQKRLLADISHELRSPLARLQLAIGIANQTSSGGDRHLQRIEKEAQEIEDMIERVLTLSRLQSQKNTMPFNHVNLTELLQKVVDDASFEASSQDKHIQLSSPHATITIEGDEALLLSAIENVVRNAVKYASQKVEIFVILQDKQVTLQICDDGEGVEDDQLANIFSPFYRLSSARSRDTGGAGLGLAIAMESINAHNGNIKAMNHSPHGLIVEICLPLTDN